jgi:RNA polymerase sigma factor (sigma-70 family)
MSAVAIHSLLHHIQRIPTPGGGDGLTDRQVLERFAAGDQDVFAVLLRRHGPLVWGICRRELGHEQDAEDVFQATFLVLARKAGTGQWQASVARWLFETAYRLASETRRKARRLEARHRRVSPARASSPAPASEAARRELEAVLDEELARLPEAYRSALLLCVLGGEAREEAARQLGCSVRSVKHRLERGRDLLRQRLSRRGWSLGTALLVASLGSTRGAAPPAVLLTRTAQAAGGSPAATSPTALTLVEGALKSGTVFRGKLVLALALVVGMVATTAGAFFFSRGAGPAEASPEPAHPAAPASGRRESPREKGPGDPLPAGALKRFGTTRFRHPTGVQALALSPDGKALATMGGGEGFATIQLMDPVSGKVRHLIRNVASDSSYSEGRCLLAFAPDSKTLASGGKDGVARLYDVATGKPAGKLPPTKGAVYSVAFSPDGKSLATCGANKTVRLWDLEGNKERWTQASSGEYVLFSPGGKVVAMLAASGKDTIAFLDADTGKEIRMFSHGVQIVRAAFSPDGKFLVTGGGGKVIVWEAATGKEHRTLIYPKPERKVEVVYAPSALALSSDGKTLATGGTDKLIRLWDLATGKETHPLEGHDWWVVDLAFSPDGKTLYSGSWDATVRRWDVKAGKELPGPEGYTHSARIACSADGRRMAISGGGAREVQVWDEAGKRVGTVPLPESPLNCLTLTPDGQRLATGHQQGGVYLWEVGTGRLLRTLRESEPDGPRLDVGSLAFSPDGRALAAGGPKGAAHVWYFKGKPAYRALPHKSASVVAWGPDGKTLATGGWDRKIRLWDAAGKQLAEIDPGDIVDSLAFSPDGRLLASSHHAKPIQLWDVRSHEEVRRLEGHREVVWSVAFSPDGLWLASAGLDHTVRLWDVAAGEEVLRLEGHGGWVIQAAFARAGRTLLTSSLDTTAILWSLRPEGKPIGKGEERQVWEALRGDPATAYRAVWALAESPKEGVALLRGKVKAARPVVAPERLKRLLADLDSENFAVREAATRELKKLGPEIEPSLRRVLEETKSAEVKRRVQGVLATLSRAEDAERLRQRRAVVALERMGTAEARELLRTLAGGAADAPLTRSAREALGRMGSP